MHAWKHWAGAACLLPLVTLGSGTAAAADPEATDFSACVDGIALQARQHGISDRIIDDVLRQVEHRERVIELDRSQPEFTTTFADYLDRRVTPDRVRRGRRMLDSHGDLLDAIADEYGVPAHYLVAFWGLETNYGRYFGRMSVVESLATLACDPRRSGYFTRELLAALRILDEGAITPEGMEGSWAGAMGHVQFMPSVFLRYAEDYDGDGRRDLWGSLPDALASAANYLSSIGWETGLRWGREVFLPEAFDYSLAGRDKARPLSEWARMGLRRAADGSALPPMDIEAAVLVPAGHEGPAFLVYRNFDIIMKWNRSEFYALAVGHLADRIAGGGTLRQPPPGGDPMSRDQVRALQERLREEGYYDDSVDGIFGSRTRRALQAFQADRGLVADGFPSDALLADPASEGS